MLSAPTAPPDQASPAAARGSDPLSRRRGEESEAVASTARGDGCASLSWKCQLGGGSDCRAWPVPLFLEVITHPPHETVGAVIPGRKIRFVRTADVVVGGWVPGRGRLTGLPGAVLVGEQLGGQLHYAGSVGTGWSRAERTCLAGLLHATAIDTCPFAEIPPGCRGPMGAPPSGRRGRLRDPHPHRTSAPPLLAPAAPRPRPRRPHLTPSAVPRTGRMPGPSGPMRRVRRALLRLAHGLINVAGFQRLPERMGAHLGAELQQELPVGGGIGSADQGSVRTYWSYSDWAWCRAIWASRRSWEKSYLVTPECYACSNTGSERHTAGQPHISRSFIRVAHTPAANRNRRPRRRTGHGFRHRRPPRQRARARRTRHHRRRRGDRPRPTDELKQLWATSGITTIRRDPAQPGVRARVHADIGRTNPGSQSSLPRDGEEQAATVNP